jgi:hypothetical protein
MKPREPGLEPRVDRARRRISSQHRQLDSLYDIVADALRRQMRAGTASALSRFRDALEAHLSLEETLYFPAIHGLYPQLERDLRVLVREHGALREEFDAIDRGLAQGVDLRELGYRLEAAVAELSEHESREEELVARTGGGVPDS